MALYKQIAYPAKFKPNHSMQRSHSKIYDSELHENIEDIFFVTDFNVWAMNIYLYYIIILHGICPQLSIISNGLNFKLKQYIYKLTSLDRSLNNKTMKNA